MVLIWFGTFIFVMGFFPPSRPSATAEEIRQLYADNTVLIKLGLVVVMAASALLVPWAAVSYVVHKALTRQIAEGTNPL